jgi:predicted dehydrogenase
MKILIIGLGSIAQKHLKAIKQLELNCEVYALRSSINSDKIEGVKDVYDLNQLLELKIDFAIISTPTHLHFENIVNLSNANIPLFIEKPAIHSLNNANELVEKIEKQNLITYVACNLRFHPCLLYLRDIIPQLKINEVNVYCGSYLPDWRPNKDFRLSYSSSHEMGGGAHLDLFHELDYSIWLLGMPKTSNSVLRNRSSLEIEAIDYANYILEYESFAVNVVLNLFRRKAKRTIELVLENETLTVDLINNSITNDFGETIFSVIEYDNSQTYLDQLKYFIDCLSSGTRPMNSLRESIEILKVVLGNV